MRNASVMAKVAMASMMKLRPSSRFMLPKVNRCTPEVWSVPTVASMRPTTVMEQGFEKTPGPGECRYSGKPHNHKGEVVRRLEAFGHIGHERRAQHEQDHGQRASRKRGVGGDGQGLARFALLGHGVSVNGGGHRGRFARGVDQNRAGRSAEYGAVVDTGQQDHARGRIKSIGHRGS